MTNHDAEGKDSQKISTIHRLYKGDDEDIVYRDPKNRRSFINKTAYAKLHRAPSSTSNRYSVGCVKDKFEKRDSKDSFSPDAFGYPKSAKLVAPMIKPRPEPKKGKDVNSNTVRRDSAASHVEIDVFLQPSSSVESVDKIAKELSDFEMDSRPKERKRVGSFRRFLLGSLFTKDKDKKKKGEEKKQKNENVHNDNIRNESNVMQRVQEDSFRMVNSDDQQEQHELRIQQLEQEYADLHVNRFNSIRQNFNGEKANTFVVTDSNKKTDGNGTVRDTPPRAQETHQNISVVKPKSTIILNSERSLANSNQNESSRTIERNLNKSENKDYPEKGLTKKEDTIFTFDGEVEAMISKPPIGPKPVHLMSGTVFREPVPINPVLPSPNSVPQILSPKSPTSPHQLGSAKLRLPPNRERYEPQPRVKSPIPMNRIREEKIIATELLKARASPPLPRRTTSISRENQQGDRIVTDALIHTSPSPYSRAPTPLDLRMSTTMKMSPAANKADVKKVVEEYYWKQLRKLKDEEDQKLYSLQMYEPPTLKRTRSLSPSQRNRRTSSVSRNNYAKAVQQQRIPEDQTLTRIDGPDRIVYDNFVRNKAERRSVDSMQRPIFRRGSLTQQEIYEVNPYKRVSFHSQPVWPTRSGYVPSPPQRRFEPEVGVYATKPVVYQNRSEPLYTNRVLEQFRRQPSNGGYYGTPLGSRHVSMDSLPRSAYSDTYGSSQMMHRPMSTVYKSRSLQHNPVYSPQHYAKQVTLRNKYCDPYGQIHDEPTSGVMMGQVVPRQSDPVVQNSRLSNELKPRLYDARTRYENRPLPALPKNPISDTESGSDASEIHRIFHRKTKTDEEWNADGKSGRNASGNDSGRSDNESEVRGSRSRNTRRDDPRRHTLGGDQQYLGMSGQGGPLSRTMDLEGQPRMYPPPSKAMLFDDDPGIMSEVETSSTGFRRGGKQRSSLPVVRTPSKTLERPLVFLQYRNETKRALLPNEITSIDTVKALFVRSFPKQLTMEYLDSPNVKIYIHDSSKDMFYELEDLRSHLREIRDRSVLRLFESADVSGGLPMAGIGIAGGVGHFEDPSYFSEPEFDSEYQHQHIHKSKGSTGKAPYYMGSTASLPRGTTLLRTYSPAVGALPADRIKSLPTGAPPKPQRAYSGRSSDGPPRPPDRFAPFQRPDNPFHVPDGYMSSPERGSRYEDPYYTQYTTRSGSITPVIDEEVSDTELLDDSYSLYGVKLASGVPRGGPRSPFPPPTTVPYDATRLRVENMERQLANLTGLVQKALTQTPTTHLQVPGRENYRERDRLKPAPPPKPASLSPGQYDGRLLYRDLQLTPEMYNQLRGLQKKAKDLKAEVRNLRRMSQAQAHSVRETIRDTFIKIRAMLLAGGEQVWQAGMDQERVRLNREEDLYKQEMLRLEKDLGDLESTVEELRGNVINRKTRVNMSDVENMALVLSKSSKTVADLKLRFPGLQDGMKTFLGSEMEKMMREEKFLKEEPERLESALRRCKKLTGTLVTLKRLASVQEQRLPCSNSADGRLSPTATETPPVTPTSASSQHSKVSPRLGSLVVGGDPLHSSDSAQRPENALDALLDELQTFSKPHNDDPPALPSKPAHPPMCEIGRKGSMDSATFLPTQNLTVSTTTGSLRRLHSYPSGSDTDNSPPIQPQKVGGGKPPIPERNAELLQHVRRVPPPPPPRTSSKSPLASPTSPSLPPRSPASNLQHIQNVQNIVENKAQSQFEAATQNLGLSTLKRNVPSRSSFNDKAQTLPRNLGSNLQIPQENEIISSSNSTSCESVNSQDGKKTRKEELEQRHQELLKKQKALQEQYARLQQLQRGSNTLAVVPPTPDQLLKKTGSESNLIKKMGLQLSTTGSLTNLPNTTVNNKSNSQNTEEQKKVYETDIL